MHGSYHSVSSRHLPRYLAEFSYRFNRRFSLREMFPRLAYVALRTQPIPNRVLKLAENCAEPGSMMRASARDSSSESAGYRVYLIVLALLLAALLSGLSATRAVAQVENWPATVPLM